MKIIKKLFWPLLFVAVTLIGLKMLYDFNFVPNTVALNQHNQQIIQKNQAKTPTKTQQAPISGVDLQDLARAKQQLQRTTNQYLVGQLLIPTIQLNLPILSQATNQTLSTGAAQYYPARKMGQGNYVLASHNFFDTDVLTHKIYKLQKGEKIFVTNATMTYEYRVTLNQVILQTKISVLTQTKQPQLTLIRCEGQLNTPYRRIVVAKLVKTRDYQAKTEQLTQPTDRYQQLLKSVPQQGFVANAAGILAAILASQELWIAGLLVIFWLVIAALIIKAQF